MLKTALLLVALTLALAAAEPAAPTLVATCPERTAFLRHETDGQVVIRVANPSGRPVPALAIEAGLIDEEGQQAAPPQRLAMEAIAAKQARTASYVLDTGLRPGHYALRLALRDAAGQPLAPACDLGLDIVARAPARMPVILWGNPRYDDPVQWKTMTSAFTHCYGVSWNEKLSAQGFLDGKGVAQQRQPWVTELLNRALVDGIGLYANLRPAQMKSVPGRTEHLRHDRQGHPVGKVCGLRPEVQEYCHAVGEACARSYGRFPAFAMALVNSEEVDHSQPCRCEHCRTSFAAWSGGAAIPEEAERPWGEDYRLRARLPVSGVVPADHPLAAYYRWYWTIGHGWNGLSSLLHDGLKSTGRSDLLTWFDPAVRAPALWGSGGTVDAILEWSYTHPDPLRAALQCDELFAMAAGAQRPPGAQRQRVLAMTQIIWYRDQSAPRRSKAAHRAAWEDAEAGAEFITIAPDHLREAFWLSLARPVDGLAYHGWQSLVNMDAGKGPAHAYRFTHPGAIQVLTEVMAAVVRPLGPALLRIGDRPSDVAYLESFTSQVLAGKGSGWADKARYYVLCYAQLQPHVVYEEGILRDGLDGVKVLVAHDCDLLPAPVVDRIRAFQARGGLVVADNDLCSAVVPDIVLPALDRKGSPEAKLQALHESARILRRELDPFYRRYADSDNPEIITRVRSDGAADYLFAVNDRRIAGDYVGHHHLVLEQGVPAAAAISLARPRGVAYDLVAGRRLDLRQEDGRLVLPLELGPGDGRLVMIADAAIARVRLAAGQAAFSAFVETEDGSPLAATVPVQVAITDPAGRPGEGSGFHAAPGGRLTLPLEAATNQRPGTWTIRVRELASGQEATMALPLGRPAQGGE